MRPPSAEPRDLLRGPGGAGAAARRRRRRPPPSTVPPWPSATWRTIARPRPEPGRPRAASERKKRSKTMVAVRRVDPGTAVAHGQLAVAQAHVDHRARRTPLGGVVEQVRDGAVQPRRDALHERGLELRSRRSRRGACRRARSTAVATSRSSRTSSTAGASGSSSRASSTRSPTSALSSSSCATRSARSRSRSSGSGGPPRASTSRFVRSDVSGVRSSCDGVGDELALRALRALERLEHRVERGRQARDLVLALRVDRGARGRAWWRRARRSR